MPIPPEVQQDSGLNRKSQFGSGLAPLAVGGQRESVGVNCVGQDPHLPGSTPLG